MSNIYERYHEFRSDRSDLLKAKITAVVNNITAVTYDLPVNRLLDLFRHYPKKNLTLKWVLQDKWISFTFDGDKDVDIKIGEKYQFTSDCFESCNALLKEYEYGLTLGKTGWCHIHNGKTKLFFSAEKGILLRNIKRFKEDILQAFPNCEFLSCPSFALIEDYDDHRSCNGEGWIFIQI